MTSYTIQLLSWFKPRSKTSAPDSTVRLTPIVEARLQDQVHYLECYKDFKFGWNLALALTENDLPFPAILEGEDLMVWRAYAYLHGAHDPAIEQALGYTLSSMDNIRAQIEGLLCCTGVSHADVSRHLNIPVDVVVAYEKLFFNIIDRRTDHKFIADSIYANSRIVENYENYLENASVSELLKRTGYNNGLDDVLYFIGISRNPFELMSVPEVATQVETMMMINGLMLSRNGWLNQNRNTMGIQHSLQLLQAAKQGGQDNSNTSPTQSLGDTLWSEITSPDNQLKDFSLEFAAIKLQEASVNA